MVVFNLFPIGALRLRDALAKGYWHARSPAFFGQPVVRVFEWLRIGDDTVFIVFGIVPLLYLALRVIKHRNRPGEISFDQPTETLTHALGRESAGTPHPLVRG
jgi:nitric oxide reductase subunit B